MTEAIFDDLVDWWRSEHHNNHSSYNALLLASLRSLGIAGENEELLSREVTTEWYQETDEIFQAIATVNLETDVRVRTIQIAGYAVVTPPPLSLAERIEIWRERNNRLIEAGVRVPQWYLIWKATIYAYYPPHALSEYFSQHSLEDYEIRDLAQSLEQTLKGLSSLALNPLGLLSSLRTDGLEVFYCGLGFDVGESTTSTPRRLLEDYESQIFPHVPDQFRAAYYNYKSHN